MIQKVQSRCTSGTGFGERQYAYFEKHINALKPKEKQIIIPLLNDSPVHARTLVCRLEKHDRDLKPDRLEKMTNVLNINAAMLKRWDFEDPADGVIGKKEKQIRIMIKLGDLLSDRQ